MLKFEEIKKLLKDDEKIEGWLKEGFVVKDLKDKSTYERIVNNFNDTKDDLLNKCIYILTGEEVKHADKINKALGLE